LYDKMKPFWFVFTLVPLFTHDKVKNHFGLFWFEFGLTDLG